MFVLVKVSFPFPFSRWKPRNSFRNNTCLSFLLHLDASLWQWPENGKWTWHLPGLFNRLAGVGSMPRSRHLLTHLATPRRSSQKCTEFQNQVLPVRGGGMMPTWSWRALWVVPGPRGGLNSCLTPGTQHLGELGCSRQICLPQSLERLPWN